MKRIFFLLLVVMTALALRAEWTGAEFIGVTVELNGHTEAKPSAFLRSVVNRGDVVSAVWRTTGLGVYEAYVNGHESGGFLKPGFSHVFKRRLETASDVTSLWCCAKGATNVLSAVVTDGWWRDEITGKRGIDLGFRCILDIRYADGSTDRVVSDGMWFAGYGTRVVQASIYDGETYDARIPADWMSTGVPPAGFSSARILRDYVGGVSPIGRKTICLREDLTLRPKLAFVWRGVDGASDGAFGKIRVLRSYSPGEKMRLAPGETLVIDFAQNASAVPRLTARADRGTRFVLRPGEMLNDAAGAKSRGNDGPEGSVYRANLRTAKAEAAYVFAGDGLETYMPRFSFFGYRYLSLAADADVEISEIESVPVSSVRREDEIGTITTGRRDLNRFIDNVRWGMLSNYLSIPTDCPQRDERLGWTGDTQVFSSSALYLADCYGFLAGWLDDLSDSQYANGAYPCVAPIGQTFGNEGRRVGYGDAGVIVPWTMWRRTGNLAAIDSHWSSMMDFMRMVDESRYESRPGYFQYADWLSYEPMETMREGLWCVTDPKVLHWWNYLGACYWLMDARMMSDLAHALGRQADAAWCTESAARALAHLRKNFLDADGRLNGAFRSFQTANLFALKLGVFDIPLRAAEAKETLVSNIREHGDCLQTGFLGTSILMDTLTAIGESKMAYTLLLQHKNPSWLYSVDQGATTVWERWNSYTKTEGFGPVDMNSFNHYSYGSVMSWMFSTMAGIREGEEAGFQRFVLAPIPDRRIGSLACSYKCAYGRIESNWHYEGDEWVWEFSIPQGTSAQVYLPGEESGREYAPGRHVLRWSLPDAMTLDGCQNPQKE